MLSQRQVQRQREPEYTAEDVEAIARFMGWPEHSAGTGAGYWSLATDENGHATLLVESADGTDVGRWNPFLSADADLQVLERARELWGSTAALRSDPHGKWNAFVGRYADTIDDGSRPVFTATTFILQNHRVGCYSRAVLAVLRSTEGEKP